MKHQSKKRVPLKIIAAASALAVLLPFASVQAGEKYRHSGHYSGYAKVIHAEPIYRRVSVRKPIQQCWTEQERYVIHEGNSYGRPHYQHNSGYRSKGSDGAVVGGVIGGVIGNEIGRNGSRGTRIGATIAGAIIGSAIGNDLGGNHKHNRHGRYKNHSYGNHSYKRHSYGNHSYSQKPTYGVRPVKRCKTVYTNHYERHIEGYKVTYVHRGQRFKTRTRKHPGSRIHVNFR